MRTLTCDLLAVEAAEPLVIERTPAELAEAILALRAVPRDLLPELDGTPAEVRSASYVREQLRYRYYRHLSVHWDWQDADWRRACATYMAAVLSHTSARWWTARQSLCGALISVDWLAPQPGDTRVTCDTCHATADLSGCRINDGATRDEEPTLTCALCQAQERPDAGPTQAERVFVQVRIEGPREVATTRYHSFPAEAA